MKNTIRKMIHEAATDHKIYDALMGAYKSSNTYYEKVLRVSEIKNGTATMFHSSLEEEVEELQCLLKKTAKKILYLNYVSNDTLLSRRIEDHEMNNMIMEFNTAVSEIIEEMIQ